MTVVFDENGLAINTYDEILAEVQTDFRTSFGSSVKTKLQSSFGQFQRLIAKREQTMQEKMLALYQNLDARTAEGVSLDQRHVMLGVTRLGEQHAEVLGTATGTPSTVINDGFRLSVGGNEFVTADGPYTIGAGGTVSGVKVVASEVGETDVSVLGAWTLTDTLAGFTSFSDDSQPVLGRETETDTESRERAETERFRRSSNGLRAIEASVQTVTGVTYVRAWHNVDTDPVDADGIPLHAINVVVEGGDDAEVAQAIWDAGPGGHLFYGTDVTETIVDGPATELVSFDRIDEVTIWADVTLTTSTSEEEAPADLSDLVKETLLAYTVANWTIGTDVLTYRLEGALLGIAGIDEIVITVSTDDGAGDPYSAAKRAMSIRQRPVLTTARITVTET